MLALTVQAGDYVTIGEGIVVQVVKTGEVCRLAIDAPRELRIQRGKHYEENSGHVPAAIEQVRKKSGKRAQRAQASGA